MTESKLIKILSKYCKEIRRGKHWICYPLLGNTVISVSVTGSDRRYLKNIKRDFRRVGIDIKEF